MSVRFEKTETPARFEPMPSQKRADRMLHVTFGIHKKQSFGSETTERQQQSSLCEAKNRSKRTYNHKQERGFRTMAAQSLVSVRFEKTETPARFEPMPSKKHTDRMLHVTFGTHKKQSFGSETPERQQQSSLCQAKNRSKSTYSHKQERGFRTMAPQSLVSVRFEKTETPARFEPMPSKKHADRMLHVTFGTHKKQSRTPQQSSLCQAKNRSKRKYSHKQERGFRTMAAQSLVSVRFEKTETPARFEPMPSKKHADRMLHVTFGTHKKQSFGSETPERQQQSSLCRAKTVRNAHITTSRNVDSERWLLKVSSASDSKRPKHQQHSSPCQAKNTQTECFTSPKLRCRNNRTPAAVEPLRSKKPFETHIYNVDSERWLLKVSSASDSKRPKHQQDSSPCQAKNTRTECFTSPLEPIKNKASVPKHPNASSSRASAEQKTVRNAHITTSRNPEYALLKRFNNLRPFQ